MSLIVKKKTYDVKEEINPYCALVEDCGKEYLIYHFEEKPNNFSNFKFASKRLKNCGIKIPTVYEIDKKNQSFLVEYIAGPTCFDDLVEKDTDDKTFEQLFMMNFKARVNNLRLDFHPDKFKLRDGVLYYLPFTFEAYVRSEDFSEKELRLWFYTKEFKDLLIEKGIKLDNSRGMNDFAMNKQIVLTVVKYFR